MRLTVALILVALFGTVLGVSYEGYKTYKVVTKSEADNAYLSVLRSHPDFDFWSKLNTVGQPVTIMVAPKAQKGFEGFLVANEIHYELQIENVERVIEDERQHHRSRPTYKSGRITFDQYYRHDEINTYLDQVAQEHSDIVTLGTIGQSYQNRDMNLIRISSGSSDPPKPVIFVDAGIHAREWIAPAVALYLIDQLLENPDNSDLYADVDWIILPSLNPDGYEYSWDEDRLWRKTVSPGVRCDGADANRNFGFHWMESGASDYECDETYAGSKAFSEVEAQNLRDYLDDTPNIVAYLTLHSYGQYLLYPWGYADILCDNWEELDDLGHAMDDAIRAVRGTRYTVGGSTATLYAAAGASDDWAKGGAGISIVYTMELPGGGIYGFDMPPAGIRAVVEETWEGLKVFGRYVAENRK